VRHQDCFLALLPGRKRISARGVSHFQSSYFVIVLLSFFALSCLHLFIKNTKKLVPSIVVIFVCMFNLAKMINPENTKLCDFTSTNNNDFICTPIAPPAREATF
jgi:uncharacterized membrane protein